ncbi:unnamed protein product, partial [Pleuronectes platessa]
MEPRGASGQREHLRPGHLSHPVPSSEDVLVLIRVQLFASALVVLQDSGQCQRSATYPIRSGPPPPPPAHPASYSTSSPNRPAQGSSQLRAEHGRGRGNVAGAGHAHAPAGRGKCGRTPSETPHDDLACTPVALSVSRPGLFHEWTGSLLICNPTRWKEEVRKPAFSAFTSRIHHQTWAEAHLERERGLTKHLLHKINASRLLPVQLMRKKKLQRHFISGSRSTTAETNKDMGR